MASGQTAERARRRLPFLAGAAGVVVAVAVLFIFFGPRSATTALTVFADAWEQRDWARMDEMTDADGELAAQFKQAHETLGLTKSDIEVGDTAGGTGSMRISHSVGGAGTWSYETRAKLHRSLLRWSVVWDPSLLHPSLRPGLRLDRRLEWPERAPITGRDDAPLTIKGTVVSIGIEPRRIKVRDETLAALEKHLDLDPAGVSKELDRPGVRPEWFVPLTDVREERFAKLRPRLEPVPGVVFRRVPARVTPSEDFARHVIGHMGEITAERLRGLGPPYRVGDTVGLSGLESVFERQLSGSPAAQIVIVDEAGTAVETVHEFGAKAPRPVRTTIERAVQAAAEQALSDVTRPAALVALDGSTGEIRAVASRPVNEPFNRALAGRYPPGSTFKIVTAASLLDNGVGANTTVSCPEEVVVGRRFRNFEGRALGTVSFRTAFVESCNTAFVRLASQLEPETLARTAEAFGFGANYDLPLAVGGGRFPLPESDAESAAAALGQGRVEASPLHMASVAGAIAAGGWRPPKLLIDEAGSAKSLDESVVATLRDWMRGVVTEGTGRAAAVGGQDVAGKTGTAEFGTGDPPPTHAWFVGFRGTLAFAVVVEGGGVGGEVAAPIAARFLQSLV